MLDVCLRLRIYKYVEIFDLSVLTPNVYSDQEYSTKKCELLKSQDIFKLVAKASYIKQYSRILRKAKILTVENQKLSNYCARKI